MPSNIEIKAHAFDACRQSQIAFQLSGAEPEVIRQKDVFFACPNGRLKLRMLSGGRGELIFYQRPDQSGPKESRYAISATDQPEQLRTVLAQAYGELGVVDKSRTLFLAGQTRIHVDEVEGLGSFIELEVVMNEGQPREEGVAIANDLMGKLRIEKGQLIDAAYIDLMSQAPG